MTSFSMNRWLHLVGVLANVKEEAKELNRKARPVTFPQHIGDGYYVLVAGGVMCIDIRKYYTPYDNLSNDQVRSSKSGLVLGLHECRR